MRSTNKRSSGQPGRGRGAKSGYKAGKPSRKSSGRSERSPKRDSGSDERTAKSPFKPAYGAKKPGFGGAKPFKRRDSDDRPARAGAPSGDRKRFSDDRGEKKSFSGRGERKPFSTGRGDRKPFSSDRGERKPYAKRSDEGRDRKPFSESRDRKPFSSDRGERKPYTRRSEEGTERKPYTKRSEEGTERKPYTRRSEEGTERKPFSEGRERKPFSSDRGERKPYTKRSAEGNDRKPFEEGGESKPKSRVRSEGRGLRQPFTDGRSERKRIGSEDPTERKPFSEEGSVRKTGNYIRKERNEEGGERSERSERPSRSFGDKGRGTTRSDDRGSRESSPRFSKKEESTDAPAPKKGAWFDEGQEKKPRKDSKSFGDKKPFGAKKSFGSKDSGDDQKWNRKETHEFYGDKKKKASAKKSAAEDDGSIRLNKFIANAGICSRREADDLIAAGVISVNGNVVTEMGYKVQPEDQVKYNNALLRGERLQYVLLNKPKDFITTTDDPDDRKTVMSLVVKACKERIYPVGRLDRNTTGVLLFTNDGDLAKKLTHPSFQIQKVYQVELDKNLKQTDFEKIESGVTLEDGFIKADDLVYGVEKNIVGIELHSGKNRIVRRIFEHLGYEVKKLDRVIFGGLTKKDLPRGRWRFLTDMEVANLKMVTGKKVPKKEIV